MSLVASVPKDTHFGYIPEHSYLDHMIHTLPIVVKVKGKTVPVPAFVEALRRGITKHLFLIGLDPGNSAMKLAMYDASGRIVTHYVPAIVAPAQEFGTGTLPVTYHERFDDGSLLMGTWIGEQALKYGASLPTGNTAERLNDPRYIPFLLQTIIELIIKAGYPPGDYDVILCLGVRNQEIRQTREGSQVEEHVQTALDHRLKRVSRGFERIDEQGATTDWRVTVDRVVAGPQSFAGFSLWYKRPDGKAATQQVHGVVDLDFGAFDLSRLLIDCTPGQKITHRRDRVGNGMMIDLIQPFAEAMAARYHLTDIDDALALQWYLYGQAQVGGFVVNVNELVAEVQARQIPSIIANAFKGQQRTTDFYRLKGGGVILMKQELISKMHDLGRKQRESDAPPKYLLLPPPYAVVENAAGLLANLDLMVRGLAG